MSSKFFGNQKFMVQVRLLTMCRGGLSAVIARLIFECVLSGGKQQRGVKCLWKKTQIEKKNNKLGHNLKPPKNEPFRKKRKCLLFWLSKFQPKIQNWPKS